MHKLAILALIILLVGCEAQEIETIKIGAILPLTGPASAIGEGMRETFEWKLEELNSEGKQIDFLIEDSQSDPKQAVTAFKNLAEVKNTKIIFTVISSVGMTLKPLAEEKQILLWADITHPLATKNSSFILRHANTVEEDSRVLIEHIKRQGFRKVGIIHQQDDWGQAMNTWLVGLLRKEGVETTIEAINHKESDFRTQISKTIQEKPDAIIFVAFGSAAGILVKQTKEAGFEGTLYSSIGFVLTPDAQKIAGDFAKGMFYTTYYPNEQFEKDYRARFEKPPSLFGFASYTDLELLLYAIEQTKSTEPDKIVKFIKSLKEFKGKYETVTITPSGDIVIPTMIKVWGE